ncbi:hypothetical protein CEP54_007588 [Fusarium duplospermum]|uniref:Uncharacterized protein n=1 Tax=Fusarium duplospermum TaxID=1325734 RepID=A0A428Q0J8_9HYPO|nr:hypothetical protein CEP54_007588 [Fusarium duplospermum]
MRLLATNSYELFEASDVPTPFPSYAILSHTWISSKDEITYQDMKTRKGDIKNDVYKQKGWLKLRKYCDRAAKDGWEWAWMDTCCIDKTNPADTQEAINAMFRWYQNAGICYAHLEDVHVHQEIKNMDLHRNADLDETLGNGNAASPSSPLHKALGSFFIASKWFTRGWTLQELLAPHYLVFVDRTWLRIGTRENWAAEVKEASNIEPRYLSSFNPTDFASCSTAMRFSWASRRETTIEEDETYSLLGLFGISLPLIYGEGRRQAFHRLQRQLIIVYNDDSLFAWKEKLETGGHSHHGRHQGKPQLSNSKLGWGILARSVRDFWDGSKVKALRHDQNDFSMTNRGLQITAKHWRHKDNSNTRLIRLDCGVESSNDAQNQKGTGIYITYDADTDAYHRIRINELCDMGQVKCNDWKEGSNDESALIRADNYSNQLAYAAMFVLQYPEQIKIVGKYAAQFSPSFTNNHIQSLGGSPHTLGNTHSSETEELSVEPSTVVFLTIELDDEGLKWELDVIINLRENCFPHVGISWRGKEGWERLGDPLDEDVSDVYNDLAAQIYFTLPSSSDYPAAAVEKTKNFVVGTHLLPRPPRERSMSLSRESALREYVLKISVGPLDREDADPNVRQGPPEDQENRRKRQRIL